MFIASGTTLGWWRVAVIHVAQGQVFSCQSLLSGPSWLVNAGEKRPQVAPSGFGIWAQLMPISEQNCKGSGVWRGCREHGHSSKVVAVTKETRFKKKSQALNVTPLGIPMVKRGWRRSQVPWSWSGAPSPLYPLSASPRLVLCPLALRPMMPQTVRVKMEWLICLNCKFIQLLRTECCT